MKKLFLSLIVVLGIHGMSEAGTDSFGGQLEQMWRSSRTITADAPVLLASGTLVKLGSVVVGSTGSVAGRITFYDTQFFNSLTSTKAYIDLSNPYCDCKEYNMTFSSGIFYQKIGNADINILWDWGNVKIPEGQINKGR